MEKHLESQSKSGKQEKRDQHASDGLSRSGLCKKHGYEHLMPLFCGSDYKVAERYGLRMIRKHTEAEGYPDCDFWYLMADDVPE